MEKFFAWNDLLGWENQAEEQAEYKRRHDAIWPEMKAR